MSAPTSAYDVLSIPSAASSNPAAASPSTARNRETSAPASLKAGKQLLKSSRNRETLQCMVRVGSGRWFLHHFAALHPWYLQPRLVLPSPWHFGRSNLFNLHPLFPIIYPLCWWSFTVSFFHQGFSSPAFRICHALEFYLFGCTSGGGVYGCGAWRFELCIVLACLCPGSFIIPGIAPPTLDISLCHGYTVYLLLSWHRVLSREPAQKTHD